MTTEQQREKWREKKRKQRAAMPKIPRQPKPTKPKPQPTIKKYSVEPLDTEQWLLIENKHYPWLIYASKEEPKLGWKSVRLISVEKAEHKASYWLGWNGKRLARSKHTTLLATHRPDLLQIVMDTVNEKL